MAFADVDDEDSTVGGPMLLEPFLLAGDTSSLCRLRDEVRRRSGVEITADPRWTETDVGAKLLTAAALGGVDSLRWFFENVGHRGFVGDLLPRQKRAIRRDATADVLCELERRRQVT